MRLEPILQSHAFLKVERPPELWVPDADENDFLQLLGEMIAAGLAGGAALAELTLNASNVVVEPSSDDEAQDFPVPGEYVAISVQGAADLGPDDRWRPGVPVAPGLLGRLNERLANAGVLFAYVRRMPPQGSVTVFFKRQTPGTYDR